MIETTHPLYDKLLPKWEKIDDIVKADNTERYLVYLNPQDKSEDNVIRNRQYRERAIFYALSGQTAQGMVGSIFRKWPVFSAPDDMQYLNKNADGAGNSIYQLSQGACHDVLSKGRAGLAVSFPQTEGQVSRAQIASGEVVATIHRFEPEQIINWRTETEGSQTKLTLVVTKEAVDEVGPDGYSSQPAEIIREMTLDYPRNEIGEPLTDTRIYIERTYRKGSDGFTLESEYYPTDAMGENWEVIPFQFVGSETNEPTPDQPPMLGIVELNIGHYRNSADYEDSVFYCGQAQPYMSGLTADHVELMKSENMYAGSRNLIGVPEGGQFGFAIAPPNPMVRQAMLDKVDQMISLGARIMQQGSATKTASQIMGEREAQTSVLALVASNVSEAFTQCLQWVARYMGSDDSELAYTLNQEFVEMEIDAPKLQQIVAGFMQGAIPMSDYTRLMRRYGLFDDDTPDEDYADLLTMPGAQSGFSSGGMS